MPEQQPLLDAVEQIGAVLDQSTDLTVRCLSNRDCLSTAAAYLLNRVDREGPARLTTLACAEGTSQPSMTQLIQRLERVDLVTRLSDPDDGRATLIGITARGQELLDERTRTRRRRLSQLMTTLTPDQQCELWLAARVALPVLTQLAANAHCPVDGPHDQREVFG